MRGRAAAIIGVAVAAALGLLAGCGGDQRAEYRQDAQNATNDFRRSAEQAAATLQKGASLREKAPAVASFKRSVDKLADTFAGLDPPDDIKPLNDEAVVRMRTLSKDLDGYYAAAKTGDTAKVRELAPTLQADQSQLQSTFDRLDAKVAGGS